MKKINNKIWLTIFMVFTVMWAVLIFNMSSNPAGESDKMSMYVGRKVATVFIPSYNEMTYDVQQTIAEKLDYPVRKAAHMTEYAVFAVLISLDIYYITEIKNKRRTVNGKFSQTGKNYESFNGYKNGKKNAVIAIIIVALYASTDEIHQLFVPGRAGLFTDVLIDTAGGIIGVIVTYFVIRGLKRVIEKNEGRDL